MNDHVTTTEGISHGIVIVGGLARLGSLLAVGAPGIEHQLALGMELGVVPLLMVWQARIERRWALRETAQ